MRVTVVDPPAYTPPYDHALCAALARRGLDVELATGPFRYGPVQAPEGYRRTECFYRLASSSAAAKALQHPLDMARLALRLRGAGRGVVHFQWLPVPAADRMLVRRFPRPRLLTAHDVLPREGGAARRRWARELFEEMDAVIVHSQAGRAQLVDDLGVPDDRVHVIPHGAFEHLARQAREHPVDPAAGDLDGRKVVLFFGLVRPYKGVDVLIDAFAATPQDTILLVVGMPRMPLEPLRRRAADLGIGDRVRFVDRFVSDAELPAYFRRADVVALPYLETEQSGVLATALAFGSPLVLSSVGGFAEVVQAHGVGRLVSPGEPAALGAALVALLADDQARAGLSQAALEAAAGPYSWDRVAGQTEVLYRRLLGSEA
jgi:glycosyltransferase involved in cell wall biosynthesis